MYLFSRIHIISYNTYINMYWALGITLLRLPMTPRHVSSRATACAVSSSGTGWPRSEHSRRKPCRSRKPRFSCELKDLRRGIGPSRPSLQFLLVFCFLLENLKFETAWAVANCSIFSPGSSGSNGFGNLAEVKRPSKFELAWTVEGKLFL